MFNTTIVKHSEITTGLLNEIIKIKSVAWPYMYDQQIQWVEEHIKPSDIHVLLSQNKKNIAYLNLVDVELTINENRSRGYGIGNVCSIENGLGYGKQLMLKTNEYITSLNKFGLLFCKTELVPFYTKVAWNIINKDCIVVNFDNLKINAMVYNNTDIPVKRLIYSGQPF